MTTIVLPISSYAKKIILQTYGPEPISLDSRSLLFYHLCYKKPYKYESLKKMNKALNDTLSFQIFPRQVQFIQKDAEHTGYYLHVLCLDKLKDFIQTATLASEGHISALKAIEIYFSINGIEENDYDIDSAYKLWQRHKSKLGKKKYEKTVSIIAQKRDVDLRIKNGRIITALPSAEKLDLIVMLTVNYLADQFIYRNAKFKEKLYKQCRHYVYRYIGKRDNARIRTLFKLTERVYYADVKRFSDLLDTEERFKQALSKACEQAGLALAS